MRKRLLILMMCVAVTGMVFTGCKDSDGETAEIANVADSGEVDAALDDSIVFAKVTAVDGNEITYEILERDESAVSDGERPEMPEGSAAPDGERPEMPEGSAPPDGERPEMPEGSAAPDGERPEMPEGSAPPDGERPEMPEGSATPDGNMPGGMMGFQSTGETGVLTLDDSVTICFMGSEGDSETASASDITEGTMLQIQYADDDSIEKIIIPKMGEKKDMPAAGEEKTE